MTISIQRSCSVRVSVMFSFLGAKPLVLNGQASMFLTLRYSVVFETKSSTSTQSQLVASHTEPWVPPAMHHPKQRTEDAGLAKTNLGWFGLAALGPKGDTHMGSGNGKHSNGLHPLRKLTPRFCSFRLPCLVIYRRVINGKKGL